MAKSKSGSGWRRAAVVGGILTVVSTWVPAHAASTGAGDSWRLSSEAAAVGEGLAIVGNGLTPFQARHQVTVGGRPVPVEAWQDDEVRFRLPVVDPGPQEVAVEPLGSGGPRVAVGTVNVAKSILPRDGEHVVPALIKVRLTAGTDPASAMIDGDSFERLLPDADPGTRLARWYVVHVPEGQEVDRIHAYAASEEVEVAEYEGAGGAAVGTNDTYYSNGQQWNVGKSRLTAAWEVRIVGWSIAIIDSGIRTTHEDLVNRVVRNRDFTGSGTAPCNYHGTAVASVAAARTNDGEGVAGAAWKADVGSYKVLSGSNCTGTSTQLTQAITSAIADGFRVVNMSLQNFPVSAATQDAVDNGWNNGAFFVAAAGNQGASTPNYPAAYDRVFAVAASTTSDSRAGFSNYGSWVHIAAPGDDIRIAHDCSNSCYAWGDGTSFSAPLVAGAVSLLRAAGVSKFAIDNRLQDNADPISWGSKSISGGRLNAYRALVPSQGCIRDLPQGAWVKHSDGRVFQVASTTALRHVPSPEVLASWRANADVVPICAERFAEMGVSSAKWGYRPGSLVEDPGTGAVYLITTDGTDRGLPTKRWITNRTVMDCFGWSVNDVIDDDRGSLVYHPTGSNISTCVETLRLFPNGSLVRASSGAVYMVEGGQKRHVADSLVRDSWFSTSETVSATSTELTLLPTGDPWGFRQGHLIKASGNAKVYVVTDDGLVRARGSRRWFVDRVTLEERGFGSAPWPSGAPSSVVDLHPEGPTLRNADDISL